jgi:hypothetical protein
MGVGGDGHTRAAEGCVGASADNVMVMRNLHLGKRKLLRWAAVWTARSGGAMI